MTKRKLMKLSLCTACLPAVLLGSTITFVSGGDPKGLSQWNSVNGPKVANVVLTPEPAWQEPIGLARWISFTDSGVGGVFLSNSGVFGALGANPTASFFITFDLPNFINTGGMTVWGDDTAAVVLVDNPASPQVLFAGNSGPAGLHCASGPISCGPGSGGFVDLSGLSAGSHTLRIDAWQLGGQTFGVMYTARIESVTVPEPGTATCLLGALALIGFSVRWRQARQAADGGPATDCSINFRRIRPGIPRTVQIFARRYCARNRKEQGCQRGPLL
jgi:hypothetical protein